MTSRTSHADDHDLIVDFQPGADIPRWAYAIAKRTYRIEDDTLELTEVEPLQHDIRDPSRELVFPIGSDFWPFKRLTDVVVNGRAYAPGGEATSTEARIKVGAHEKRIAVFGRREVLWTTGGRPYIGPAEPFSSMPLDHRHAYGGGDPRVAAMLPSSSAEVLSFMSDHPGGYPRNPFGKGYLVEHEPVDGVELPNLEDPDDLLDDDRLVTGDPAAWHRQPLPWALDWWHLLSFPRFAFLGDEPHTPVAPEQLREVERGYFEVDYRQRRQRDDDDGEAFRQRMFQGASLGLALPPLEAGTPITFVGMHPERRTMAVELPEPPEIAITVDGDAQAVPVRPTAVIAAPDAERLSIVYLARRDELPRTFIPRIHPAIPLSANVDGGEDCHYVAPPTLQERRGHV